MLSFICEENIDHLCFCQGVCGFDFGDQFVTFSKLVAAALTWKGIYSMEIWDVMFLPPLPPCWSKFDDVCTDVFVCANVYTLTGDNAV